MSLVVLALFAVTFCATVESIGNVAFFATIEKGYILGQNQVVTYDTVITNVGNAFDTRTGIFTARKRGIYVFHFSTLASLNTRINLLLFKNDVNIVKLTADVPNYPMAANTAVVSLERGDRVYVKTYFPSSNFYSGSYTTFSGYMIELGDGEE